MTYLQFLTIAIDSRTLKILVATAKGRVELVSWMCFLLSQPSYTPRTIAETILCHILIKGTSSYTTVVSDTNVTRFIDANVEPNSATSLGVQTLEHLKLPDTTHVCKRKRDLPKLAHKECLDEYLESRVENLGAWSLLQGMGRIVHLLTVVDDYRNFPDLVKIWFYKPKTTPTDVERLATLVLKLEQRIKHLEGDNTTVRKDPNLVRATRSRITPTTHQDKEPQ